MAHAPDRGERRPAAGVGQRARMVNALLRRLPLIMLLCALGSSHLGAQSIRGRVVDDSTGDPLRGVLVEVLRSDALASTDLTGTFLLQLSRPGLVRLRLTLPAYAPLESDTIRVVTGLTATVLLRMRSTAIPLEPIVAEADARGRASGFYERARQPGFGRFITRADISTRPATSRTTELLRGLPGIEILPVRRPRSASTINTVVMSGTMGRCQPAIYIDGAPVKQFPESGLDDFLKPDMIEGVEIYNRSASAPAFLTAPPTCGVVAFWTRTGSGEGAQKWTLKRVLTAAGVATAMVVLIGLAR